MNETYHLEVLYVNIKISINVMFRIYMNSFLLTKIKTAAKSVPQFEEMGRK